ncbi:hypothetical protein BC831DRAFT_220209 [Entophlyctis helioformis]|nr:hypothetical protein BC831DRAFT_220209 [Entophlyctis helioformis]
MAEMAEMAPPRGLAAVMRSSPSACVWLRVRICLAICSQPLLASVWWHVSSTRTTRTCRAVVQIGWREEQRDWLARSPRHRSGIAWQTQRPVPSDRSVGPPLAGQLSNSGVASGRPSATGGVGGWWLPLSEYDRCVCDHFVRIALLHQPALQTVHRSEAAANCNLAAARVHRKRSPPHSSRDARVHTGSPAAACGCV